MPTPQKSTPSKSAFGKRLDRAMKVRGLTGDTTLAKLVGRHLGANKAWHTTRITDYRSGEKRPGLDAIQALSAVLAVSAHWLVTGKGPMAKEPDRPRSAFDQAVSERVLLAMKRQSPSWSSETLSEALASRWGDSTQPSKTVGDWLSGRSGFTAQTLCEIAELLDVSADWLLWGDIYPCNRSARTRIGALGDELKEHLWRSLLVPTEGRAFPIASVHEALPSGDATLRAVEQLARELAQRLTGDRAAEAWTLLANTIEFQRGESYGASLTESEELTSARQYAQGMAHVSRTDPSATDGLSPWRAVHAQNSRGKWHAEMALYGAGVWLPGFGFLLVVERGHPYPGALLASNDAFQVMAVYEPEERASRAVAEDAAKRRLRLLEQPKIAQAIVEKVPELTQQAADAEHTSRVKKKRSARSKALKHR